MSTDRQRSFKTAVLALVPPEHVTEALIPVIVVEDDVADLGIVEPASRQPPALVGPELCR